MAHWEFSLLTPHLYLNPAMLEQSSTRLQNQISMAQQSDIVKLKMCRRKNNELVELCFGCKAKLKRNLLF